jgi:hypothetical protein
MAAISMHELMSVEANHLGDFKLWQACTQPLDLTTLGKHGKHAEKLVAGLMLSGSNVLLEAVSIRTSVSCPWSMYQGTELKSYH